VLAAPTLYESFTTAGDANSANIYGGIWVAEQFTSQATSHTVSSIKVELLRVGTPSTVTVGLYNAVANLPTTKITSVTYAGTILSDVYSMLEFDITDQSLLPSTQYAIVVSCTNGDVANYVQWHQVNAGGLANAIGSDSTNSGVSWVVDAGGADYLFEIYGDVVIQVKGANVYRDYIEDGDWLIVAECINIYPDYYNVTQVTSYFNVQLLNVAGTDVLAATTLKTWGDAPVSIYLSPSMTTALTYGNAYIVSMIGTFAGTPSVNYTLQITDWIGSDLSFLDQWCLKTAKSMNTYDGNTTTKPYTTKTSDGGEVLTTYGGGDFVSGVIAIMSVRPNIFETQVRKPDYDDGTATNSFDNAVTWEDQVGTQIAADAAIFGNVFGVTDKQLLSMGMWAMYAFAIIFVFFNRQGAETPFVLILCVPLLFMGLNLRLISIQIFGIFSAIAVMLWLMKTWFNK